MMDLHAAQRPYKRYGAAITAWKSRRREVVLAGPAGTGKSRLWLEKLHYCADKYAGMRGLIVRKTRKSITQSAMVTFEQKVLPEGMLGKAIFWRTQEQEYRYPNGSIIAVAGLDDPSKVMSSEWDMIYPQEATELTEEDWGALTTRIRNGVMPYQQIGGDCNPSYPTHWLKLRAARGELLLLESRHEDNPTITPAYLAALDALPGVLRLRLRYGQWAAAEGMVYESWDRAVHVVSLSRLIEWGIVGKDGKPGKATKRVIAGVDWGYTNPGCIQVFALDGDARAYMLYEIYRTQRTIDWWIEQAKYVQSTFGIELFVCDPSEPAYIEQFNKAQLPAIGAINDIAPGISALQERLQIQPDGRTRFSVFESALESRDELRDAAHHPCSFTQEIEAYCWPKSKEGAAVKEVPVKVNDHAMDAARYVCMHLADPTRSAQDHVRELQRRVEIQRQRDLEKQAVPSQGTSMPAPQKRAWWEG